MPLPFSGSLPRQTELVALSLTPFRWRRTLGESLRRGLDPGSILDRVLSRAQREPGFDRATLLSRAAAVLARARERGVHLIAWDDASYPAALSTIVDPPPVLWARGNLSALSPRAVAIVGSRGGSPYALTVAERLAADLALRGIVVVSGLARGVDSAAHRGALAVKGATVAVFGSGVDVVYPAEHRALSREIENDGVVLSELVPGTPPQKQFFPLRNRIISGLSRAVLIVEAGEKSGSLITARCALEQGRDVLAVPGNVLTGRNKGGHALLKDGAKIVESADDILEELGLPAPGRPAAGDAEDPVLAGLPAGESCDLDAIAERTGLATSSLLPRLFELEIEGLVKRVGGGRFARV